MKPYLNISCVDAIVLFLPDLTFGDFSGDVGMSSIYARADFLASSVPLVLDHQELACTPKGPPRPADVKEKDFNFFHGHIY